MNLITHLHGRINGVEFSGKGVGSLVSDVSEGEIALEHFPTSFAAPLCRSWRCKHHPHLQVPYLRAAGNRCEYDQTIQYAGAARGRIHTQAVVQRGPGDFQEAWNGFFGRYKGPTVVRRNRVHRELLLPLEAGEVVTLGYREFDTDGGRVSCEWSGSLRVTDVRAWKPKPVLLEYEWEDFSWRTQDGKPAGGRAGSFVYRKKLRLSSGSPPRFEVRPALGRDLPAVFRCYEADYVRIARLGALTVGGPRMTESVFREFAGGRGDTGLLVALRAGRVAGFVAMEATSHADYLRGPYADIVWLAPHSAERASGVEVALVRAAMAWAAARGLRVVQSTAYAADLFTAGLLQWAGLGSVAHAVRGACGLPGRRKLMARKRGRGGRG